MSPVRMRVRGVTYPEIALLCKMAAASRGVQAWAADAVIGKQVTFFMTRFAGSSSHVYDELFLLFLFLKI